MISTAEEIGVGVRLLCCDVEVEVVQGMCSYGAKHRSPIASSAPIRVHFALGDYIFLFQIMGTTKFSIYCQFVLAFEAA